MNTPIDVSILRKIVEYFSQAGIEKYFADDDKKILVSILTVIAETLQREAFSTDVDKHLLRCSEAAAMCGFLASKYKGIARKAATEADYVSSKTKINLRDEIVRTGAKATDAKADELASVDEQCVARRARRDTLQEIADCLDSLRWALRDRHEALLEISRNQRATMKE